MDKSSDSAFSRQVFLGETGLRPERLTQSL
jgi:hypothetical protein